MIRVLISLEGAHKDVDAVVELLVLCLESVSLLCDLLYGYTMRSQKRGQEREVKREVKPHRGVSVVPWPGVSPVRVRCGSPSTEKRVSRGNEEKKRKG